MWLFDYGLIRPNISNNNGNQQQSSVLTTHDALKNLNHNQGAFRMKTFAGFMMAALLVLAVTAYAGDKPVEQKTKHATFEGKLVCLGCDLKEAEGARAACSVYGHRHMLKTKDGQYVNFLENKYSKDLIKGEKHRGQSIQVEGTYYPDAHTIDVETFTVDGKKMGWCNHCKAMDSCPFKGKGKM